MILTVNRAVLPVLSSREEHEAEVGDAEARRERQELGLWLVRYVTVRELGDEWAGLPLSVIGEPLYAEIDRFQSEADFRAALAGPLAALGVVVLARSAASWWVWALGIAGIVAVVLALGFAWRQATNQADAAIANGIFADKIKPVALQPEQIRQRLDLVRLTLLIGA
jgi:hypothetical protein